MTTEKSPEQVRAAQQHLDAAMREVRDASIKLCSGEPGEASACIHTARQLLAEADSTITGLPVRDS
jgi:hypothetical protein